MFSWRDPLGLLDPPKSLSDVQRNAYYLSQESGSCGASLGTRHTPHDLFGPLDSVVMGSQASLSYPSIN